MQFSQNEAAFSVAVCTFASRSDTEWYVVVGTASHMTLSPRTCSGGSLVLFKLSPDGAKLEHVHTVRDSLLMLAYHVLVHGQVAMGTQNTIMCIIDFLACVHITKSCLKCTYAESCIVQ